MLSGMMGARARQAAWWSTAILPVALMLAYAFVFPPTLVSWAGQTEGFEPFAVPSGPAAISQEIRGEGRPIDAVSLMLPTENNALEGSLHVEVSAESADPGPSTGSPDQSVSASVDLADVQDWGLHVFRLPDGLAPDADSYLVSLRTDNPAHVAAGSGDPYPEGALIIQGQPNSYDLRFKVYERVGPWRYLRHVADSSRVEAPAWLLVLLVFMVPTLFVLALLSLASARLR